MAAVPRVRVTPPKILRSGCRGWGCPRYSILMNDYIRHNARSNTVSGDPTSSTATRLVIIVMLISGTMRRVTIRSAPASNERRFATASVSSICFSMVVRWWGTSDAHAVAHSRMCRLHRIARRSNASLCAARSSVAITSTAHAWSRGTKYAAFTRQLHTRPLRTSDRSSTLQQFPPCMTQ